MDQRAMQPLQILLIEDDPDDAELIGEQLRKCGLTVELAFATRLADALTMLERTRADAVLLDLTLPDCRGPETLARLRSAAPSLPIVVLTGLEDEELGLHLVQSGAQDYWVKGQVTSAILTRSLRYAIERKRTEAALAQAMRAAESASRAKAEFLANVSHELRTPMNAILGLTDLAIESDPPPELRESLLIVRESAESLLSLIDNLLDVMAIETGRCTLAWSEFSLRALLDRLVGQTRVPALAKGIPVTLRCADEIPDILAGDPDRLAQLLSLLLENAIKFTEHGSIGLAVAIEGASEMRITLRFSVRDTGIGICEEQAARIFEPFTQADGSLSRRYGGVGLGLALATRLAKLMQGSLGLESSLGMGSTFHFTVDLALGNSRSPSHRVDDPMHSNATRDPLSPPP